jgi:hypothetical protein
MFLASRSLGGVTPPPPHLLPSMPQGGRRKELLKKYMKPLRLTVYSKSFLFFQKNALLLASKPSSKKIYER